MSQFEVHTLIPIGSESLRLDFTNVAFYAFAAVALISLILFFATRRVSMVPGRMQSVGELVYEFIAKMITDIIGPDGLRFLPYVFALFSFVLACNLIGLIPSFFTVTSQLSITLMLGVMSISIVIIFGLYNRGLGFFTLFAPPGLPWWFYPLIVPIELISFFARPFTLAVRLFANMLAGHLILKLFGGFVVSLALAGMAASGIYSIIGVLGAIVPFLGILAITALELLVAFLQAYVFAILTVIYLNEAVHDHH